MNLDAQIETLKAAIRDVPDFPKAGILFKDITTLLQDPVLFRRSIDLLVVACGDRPIDKVVAIESRGFLFGGAIAHRLGAGLVPVRKPGKLPWKTIQASYELEYGTDSVEMHADALADGDRVLIVDDVIATGGTASAVAELTKRSGATLSAYVFLAELTFLNGREKLPKGEIISLIRF
jgi:adenine phosphoribosyltransferase